MDGPWLADMLADKYHLIVEMAGENHIVIMTSTADRAQAYERLFQALSEIDRMLKFQESKSELKLELYLETKPKSKPESKFRIGIETRIREMDRHRNISSAGAKADTGRCMEYG